MILKVGHDRQYFNSALKILECNLRNPLKIPYASLEISYWAPLASSSPPSLLSLSKCTTGTALSKFGDRPNIGKLWDCSWKCMNFLSSGVPC